MSQWTIGNIKYANKQAGFYWFEPATLRFFASRIGRNVYQGAGGIYFVSSEQFTESSGYTLGRKYTVRQFNPETGDVDTVGEFNKLSRSTAVREAQRLARG